MRDFLSKLNLLNVAMQTQSLPFSTLKVLVNATREGPKREWIDISASSHPMLASEARVTGGDSFKRLVEQMKSGKRLESKNLSVARFKRQCFVVYNLFFRLRNTCRAPDALSLQT